MDLPRGTGRPGLGVAPDKERDRPLNLQLPFGMWQVSFGSVRRILCLGAHSDDIEIGAGGTLLKLIAEVPDLEICWVVFSAPGPRAEEARLSANAFLDHCPHKVIKIGSFRESYFPSEWISIKDWFEEIKAG